MQFYAKKSAVIREGTLFSAPETKGSHLKNRVIQPKTGPND
ncbi:hypothetical protein [Leptospira yanagawae]|nr:hypothetical protein [Leptospira yanagawae]